MGGTASVQKKDPSQKRQDQPKSSPQQSPKNVKHTIHIKDQSYKLSELPHPHPHSPKAFSSPVKIPLEKNSRISLKRGESEISEDAQNEDNQYQPRKRQQNLGMIASMLTSQDRNNENQFNFQPQSQKTIRRDSYKKISMVLENQGRTVTIAKLPAVGSQNGDHRRLSEVSKSHIEYDENQIKQPDMQINNSSLNLFDNEADILFSTKGMQSEEDTRIKKPTIQVAQKLPSLNDDALLEQVLRSQNKAESQGDSQLRGTENSTGSQDNKNQSDLLFKHEIIQASKSKTTKDSFKKGNIFLTVQEEGPNLLQKQLLENYQSNIIADLVANNISITDFLISEKDDIREQILVQKQKLKQNKLQAQQEGDQIKKQRNRKNNSSVSSINPSENNNSQEIQNPQQNTEQTNIIISYSQDWEKMRKEGFKDSSPLKPIL